ncbi:MAG: argininosuccinate lyase, partial [Pseudomonadota bacterium]
CMVRMNESPLGAAALAGTSFDIDRDMTAAALGFIRPCANAMDAVAARDFACEFLGAAAICAVHLSRLAEEMVIWSTDRFHFIKFSDAWSTGSSIMPQKRNPDAAELVRGKAGRVCAQMQNLLMVMKGLPLSYSKDMQEDKEPVFQAVDHLIIMLQAMDGMASDMQVNTEAMRKALQEGYPTATDLADWLVRVGGLTFRDAHHVTGKIVALASETSRNLQDLLLTEMQAIAPQIDDSIYQVLAVDHAMNARTSYGGTAQSVVKAAIAQARKNEGV